MRGGEPFAWASVHFAVKRLWIFLSVGLGYAPGIREEWRLRRIPQCTLHVKSFWAPDLQVVGLNVTWSRYGCLPW